MKSIIVGVSVCIFVSGVARAEEKMDFSKHKAEMVAGIEERIQKLQELKTCVSAAADHAAAKACHANMKEWREGERKEHMEKRMGRMQERMKKMEEKKK